MSSSSSKDLSKKSFWEKFYTQLNNKNFEWFLGYEDLKEYLNDALEQNSKEIPRILEIGCGTSNLSLQIFNHLQGRCIIDCVDYSKEAIRIMNSRLEKLTTEKKIFTQHKLKGRVSFHVADAQFLPFDNEQFHLSIDKGTSDAVLRAENGDDEFIRTVTENLRVLRNGGTIIQVSDEGPESRMDMLEKVTKVYQECSLHTRCKNLGCFQGIEYFLYTINKN